MADKSQYTETSSVCKEKNEANWKPLSALIAEAVAEATRKREASK